MCSSDDSTARPAAGGAGWNRSATGVVKEGLHVGGESRVMLEEESMSRARIDLHASLRDQTGE